jgi:hypothetical protein
MDLIFWRHIKIFPSVSNSRVPCLQWHQTFTGLTVERHLEVSQGRCQGQWSCQGYDDEALAHSLWSLKNWWLESNFVRIGASSSYNSFSQFSLTSVNSVMLIGVLQQSLMSSGQFLILKINSFKIIGSMRTPIMTLLSVILFLFLIPTC